MKVHRINKGYLHFLMKFLCCLFFSTAFTGESLIHIGFVRRIVAQASLVLIAALFPVSTHPSSFMLPAVFTLKPDKLTKS